MLLTALCMACVLPAQGQPLPRLRTELPNGVIVLAERLPEAKTVAVQLLAGSRGITETKATHGRRHLLEHLLVKGQDGLLDRRLESKGLFLNAQTLRDAMQIGIEGPVTEWNLALTSLRSLLDKRDYSQEQIDKESRIIGEELALETDARRLSAAAWLAAYGEQGLDPDGDPQGLPKTTRDDLKALQEAQFSTPNLVIAISGPLDVDEATKRAIAVFGDLPKRVRAAWDARPDPKPDDVSVLDASGAAIGIGVPSVTEPRTAWVLAASLAVASELDRPFVIYTPTIRRGLVIVGTEGESASLKKALVARTEAEIDSLFQLGKRLGQRWVSGKLDAPAVSAFWRGYLLAQAPGATLEAVTQNLNTMTTAHFREGMAMLRGNGIVHVEGTAPAPSGQTAEKPALPRLSPPSSGLTLPTDLECAEIPDQKADEIVVEAVVGLPVLTQRQFAAAQLLARTMLMGNGFYTGRQLRGYGGQTGRPPAVAVMPDHLRISLSLPPNELALAVSMIASMLKQATCTEDDLARAKSQTSLPTGVWERALRPWSLPVEQVKLTDIQALSAAIFRPENVRVTFAGAFKLGEAVEAWSLRVDGWNPPKAALKAGPEPTIRAFSLHRRSVGTAEFIGREFPAWDGALSTRLLAVFALGVGKGGAAYRVLREQQGLSYRQEAFLWPTPGGFVPRIVYATTRTMDPASAAKAREALIADVKSWTADDLTRALAMAHASLRDQILPSPIYLTPSGSAGDGLSAKAFLAAYSRLKFGKALDMGKLLEQMRMVRLTDLKETALMILEGSTISVIAPRS